MAAIDYKKRDKALYLPPEKPVLVEVPPIPYVAVRGRGDPNPAGGPYAEAVGLLYAISYTIKMSHLNPAPPAGYFPYVVPPLEGLWWMEDGRPGIDYGNKAGFCWISLIRLPEFADESVFAWAKAEAARKKGLDAAKAEFLLLEEGLCAQCMHLGAYDDEPATVAKLDAFIAAQGCANDFSESRRHHEIYLSDPRRTAVEKRKTVLRHPVKRI